MNDLLTTEEMEQLTGARAASKQAEILDLNGIYYIRRKDRSIAVCWHHVHNPLLGSVQSRKTEPDFSSLL